MSQTGNASYASLTGLRGLLALWVVLYHFKPALETLLPATVALAPLLGLGHLAVPAFFVLSGHVIMLNYAASFRRLDARALARFLLLRLARIYPVHLASMLAIGLLVLALRLAGQSVHPGGYSRTEGVLNLLLVHMWRPQARLSWNFPSWSISSEWLAYLLFPLLALLIHHLRLGRRAHAALFTASLLMAVVYHAGGWSQPYFAMLMVIPFFVCGMCIVTLAADLQARERAFAAGLALLLPLAIVALPFIEAPHGRVALLIFALALLVLALAAAGKHTPRLWQGRWVPALGEASYSLYMSHAIALLGLTKLLPAEHYAGAPLSLRIALVAVYGTVIASCCALCYYAVERPSRVWLRSQIDRVLPRRRPII